MRGSSPFTLKDAFGKSLHGSGEPLQTGVFLRPATAAGNKHSPCHASHWAPRFPLSSGLHGSLGALFSRFTVEGVGAGLEPRVTQPALAQPSSSYHLFQPSPA